VTLELLSMRFPVRDEFERRSMAEGLAGTDGVVPALLALELTILKQRGEEGEPPGFSVSVDFRRD
jgi:hypothetical protein